jgi:DNA-directed RNA polymerase specialized sigma24 family protein
MLVRLRAGDQDAATWLVRRYEPELRRAVRVRLTDPRLRRAFDSGDVCQSVLANFFVRVAAGEFDLDHPDQLLKLLLTMGRNKLFDKARRQHASRRDQHRIDPAATIGIDGLAGRDADPARIVGNRDLLAEVRRLLTDDERVLAEQRSLGKAWPEIAAEQHASPDALRKKLSRGLDRVTAQLGLEELHDD